VAKPGCSASSPTKPCAGAASTRCQTSSPPSRPTSTPATTTQPLRLNRHSRINPGKGSPRPCDPRTSSHSMTGQTTSCVGTPMRPVHFAPRAFGRVPFSTSSLRPGPLALGLCLKTPRCRVCLGVIRGTSLRVRPCARVESGVPTASIRRPPIADRSGCEVDDTSMPLWRLLVGSAVISVGLFSSLTVSSWSARGPKAGGMLLLSPSMARRAAADGGPGHHRAVGSLIPRRREVRLSHSVWSAKPGSLSRRPSNGFDSHRATVVGIAGCPISALSPAPYSCREITSQFRRIDLREQPCRCRLPVRNVPV
jgi:hypothetical protein